MRQINLIISALVLIGLIGCGRPHNIPSPDVSLDLVWPKPPARARIRFLYSVSMPGDMNTSPGVWGKIFGTLKGKQNTRIIRPYGVEMTAQGRLFVVDTFLRLIHVFDSKEASYYTFPRGGNGFISPIDIALDPQGLIYVSDSQRKMVRIFKDNGKTFVRDIGQGVLERPTGLAVNERTRELLVLDTVLSSIFRYDLQDYQVKGVIGKIGKKKDEFLYPTNIFVSKEGNIYVSDSMNFRIKVLTPEGELLKVFGKSGDTPGSFSSPKGVAVDSEDHIYVVDGMFDNVQIFDREGRLLMAFGSPGNKPGEFWLPSGIYINERDRIYVSDSYNQRVQVFQYIKGEEEDIS